MFMGKPFLSLLNMASGLTKKKTFFLGRKLEVEDDLNYGLFWVLSYVFSVGLKGLMWAGLVFIKIKKIMWIRLGHIKIKQKKKKKQVT